MIRNCNVVMLVQEFCIIVGASLTRPGYLTTPLSSWTLTTNRHLTILNFSKENRNSDAM